MDCPTCRLTNPADALHCDCGYDFTTNAASETPGWAIDLAWRQKLAAFWAISWPAAFVSLILMFALISSYSLDEVNSRMPLISLAQILIFFLIQSLLAHRLGSQEFPIVPGLRSQKRRRPRPPSLNSRGLLRLAANLLAADRLVGRRRTRRSNPTTGTQRDTCDRDVDEVGMGLSHRTN